jgi:uracil-DNA glycosylase family 4
MMVSWESLWEQIQQCQACGLCQGIRNKVPGQGNPQARLLLIGEGPGREEDAQGLAFVGPAGQLLTRMLAAISLERSDVFIANVVKCRPPSNRTPTPEEAAACLPLLRAQTALIRPQVILLLGATALANILNPQARITSSRGRWTQRKGVWILPTFHPAALLRDPSKKKDAWVDMQMVRDKLAELGEKA